MHHLEDPSNNDTLYTVWQLSDLKPSCSYILSMTNVFLANGRCVLEHRSKLFKASSKDGRATVHLISGRISESRIHKRGRLCIMRVRSVSLSEFFL